MINLLDNPSFTARLKKALEYRNEQMRETSGPLLEEFQALSPETQKSILMDHFNQMQSAMGLLLLHNQDPIQLLNNWTHEMEKFSANYQN